MSYLNTPVFLAKVEAVPGTAVNPAPATDAFLVSNLVVTPLENDTVRRAVDKGFAGANPALPTKLRNKFTLDIELAGGGAAVTPAKWATLLRACMFQAASVGASSVTYPLATVGDGDALSLWPLLGDVSNALRFKSRGVRGNAVFSFTEGQIPKLSLTLTGLLNGIVPVDSYAPAGLVLPAPPVGVEMNYLNTALTIDSYVVGAKSVEIDLGMKVTIYATTGGIAIVFDKAEDGDRRAVSFKAQFEVPDLATKNYFTGLIAGSSVPMSLVHGTVAGNIVSLTSPSLVLESSPFAVETNRLHVAVAGHLVPTAAGNELVLTTS